MKSYADECLDRAEKATNSPWVLRETQESKKVDEKYFDKLRLSSPNAGRVFCADRGLRSDIDFVMAARTDVPELALRLKKACALLRTYDEKAADELERLPGN